MVNSGATRLIAEFPIGREAHSMYRRLVVGTRRIFDNVGMTAGPLIVSLVSDQSGLSAS